MPSPEAKYKFAKEKLADGTAENPGKLQAFVDQYENDQARHQPTAEAVAVEAAKPEPKPEAPKAGPDGFWKPARPLDARDYVAQDMGGKLAVWRDMPVDVYRKKVAEPQRMAAVAAGQKAMMDFQRYGANAFAPEDQVKMTMLIAQGHAAAAQDPSSIDENDPGYQQFNEQQWQQAVQQRQADPEAGPIQRLEKMDTTSLAGKFAYGNEKLKGKVLSAARGALDMATLGLGTGALDALNEAVAGREAVDVGRGLEAENPYSHAAGSAGMAIARPSLGTAGLMSKAYGAAAPALGRYGAAALSAGAGGIAEGLGKDVSAEGADALSDAPSATMERGRLDPERLAINSALRGGTSAVAGMFGQGIADAGRGLANKISEATIRGTQGRTPYEFTEQMGWKYDPIRGPIPPPEVGKEKALTREEIRSWAERFATKARPGLTENVDKFHVAEKAAMGKENFQYFESVRGEPPTPITNTVRTAQEIVDELRGVNPYLARQVMNTVRDFDPTMPAQKMGLAIKYLSGKATEAGKNEAASEVWRRLQGAMMEDIKALPKGNLAELRAEGPGGETLEGWPALRSEHASRTNAIDEIRTGTGAIEHGSPAAQAANVQSKLMKQGSYGFPASEEKVLDRFMPPELKRESMMLRAANMVDDISSGNNLPYPSQGGLIKWAAGKALPRLYGLGRGVSAPLSAPHPMNLPKAGPPVDASPLHVLPRPSQEQLAAHMATMRNAAPSVTPEEAEAVRRFTHGYDQSIRDLQRGASASDIASRHPRGDAHAQEAASSVAQLESYMAKMPKATEIPYVYRGITLPERDLKTLLRTESFTVDPTHGAAVTSVSADPVVARSFVARNLEPGQRGVVFKIKHRSAVGTGDFASPQMAVEKELLMPGSARLRVVRRYNDTSTPGQLIIEAEEVAGKAGGSVVQPPDNFPISDKMFTFLNSRIPRATMFVPGMDLQKLVQERLEMDGRPKTFKDLTPEQQQLLLGIVSPEEKEVLQESP